MSRNNIIDVVLFGEEIGRLGYDADKSESYFQYNHAFIDSDRLNRIFPYIIKRMKPVQVFREYNGESFRGLPPMFADSLPDMFGNLIFREWMEAQNKTFSAISPLEQLAYVSNRGMGALEYRPAIDLPKSGSIDIGEIVSVLQKVLDSKNQTSGHGLNETALLNIFKIGTSAGGVRPKILISEHKDTGIIIPGDIEYGEAYNHYLVKLHIPDEYGYNKVMIEYAYYRLATQAGIEMMESRLIDGKHFASLRFDRQNGQKQHVLTTSGLTGWDFKSPKESSYENMFLLALDLKIPFRDIQELFRRMVFNIVFANSDDHLKNHSFIYNRDKNSWGLAPAYDLTFPFNTDINLTGINRGLSINGKRRDISKDDVLALAEKFSVKNPLGIIREIEGLKNEWEHLATGLGIPPRVVKAIKGAFRTLE